MGLHLIDALKRKITQSVWNFVKMHCHLTSFFVCEHGRLMIAKPNSEISGGGPYKKTFEVAVHFNKIPHTLGDFSVIAYVLAWVFVQRPFSWILSAF